MRIKDLPRVQELVTALAAHREAKKLKLDAGVKAVGLLSMMDTTSPRYVDVKSPECEKMCNAYRAYQDRRISEIKAELADLNVEVPND